jgi:hypothetical protein
MSDRVTALLRRWLDERRDSLRAGQAQDIAVSEVVEALPELTTTDPVEVGLRLLREVLSLDTGTARAELVIDLGSVPDDQAALQPPPEWSLRPERRQVQLYLTPPEAGSDQPVKWRRIRLNWTQPRGFNLPLSVTYSVVRPIGPEFVGWEPSVSLTIAPI